MIEASSWLLFFRSSVMISHLGRKPVRGGNPPMDKRIEDIKGSIIGDLFHRSDVDLIEKNEWG